MGMRVRVLVEEASRNILAGATRAVVLGLVWASVLAMLTVADALTIDALLARASDFRSSGAATMVVVAPGRIDGAACERLGARADVDVAGALRPAVAPVAPLASPGLPVPTMEATPGLVAQLAPHAVAGLLLSADAARALGVASGDSLPLVGATVTVEAVFPYPDDGRRSGLGYSAVLPVAPSGRFDECWATTWPPSDQLPGLLSTVVVDDGDEDAGTPVVSQLNTTRGASFRGEEWFRGRPTALLPMAAALAALGLGFAGVRARRLELASARHIGVSVIDQARHLVLEAAVWILLGIAVGALAVPVAIPATLAAEPAAVIASTALILGAGGAGGVAGVLAALATVSERRYVRYFRSRS